MSDNYFGEEDNCRGIERLSKHIPFTYRDWLASKSDLYRTFTWKLIYYGAMLEPNSREIWFICESHQNVDLGWLENVVMLAMKEACIETVKHSKKARLNLPGFFR